MVATESHSGLAPEWSESGVEGATESRRAREACVARTPERVKRLTIHDLGAADVAAPRDPSCCGISIAGGVERFVEAEEAAEFLHSAPRTVKQLAREGKIPAHPFGDGPRKRWFFLISELAEFLRGRVNSAHGDAADRDAKRRIQ